MKTALIVDVETTGLSAAADEIIEFSGLAFEYDEAAKTPGAIVDSYSALREPGCPISCEAQKVNRITAEMVSGQKLDDQRIAALFALADVIIAHNAKFDRAFLARLYPTCLEKPWRCSMEDIDWPGKGNDSRSLLKLARAYSIKVSRASAHRALADCQTVYQLLSVEDHFSELRIGLAGRIVGLSRSQSYIYPTQVEGESNYQHNLGVIAYDYNEDEDCDEDWHEALLYICENPRDPDETVIVKINELMVGHLKPAQAKKYRKRLADLGAPANAIGSCTARIGGGKRRADYRKNLLGVRLDFDLQEFTLEPYPREVIKRIPVVAAPTAPSPTPTPLPARPAKPAGLGGFLLWLLLFPILIPAKFIQFVFSKTKNPWFRLASVLISIGFFLIFLWAVKK